MSNDNNNNNNKVNNILNATSRTQFEAELLKILKDINRNLENVGDALVSIETQLAKITDKSKYM